MGLGHTPVEQFCYNLPHQPTLSGSSLSGHHLDDSVAREGHDAVEIEFPFYPIFEMVSLPIVQPRYSFQPFVHSSNVFAKIAIKNQIHLKSHCKLHEKSNVFEKIRVHSAMIHLFLLPLWWSFRLGEGGRKCQYYLYTSCLYLFNKLTKNGLWEGENWKRMATCPIFREFWAIF